MKRDYDRLTIRLFSFIVLLKSESIAGLMEERAVVKTEEEQRGQ